MSTYIYMYICMYIYVYIYIFNYIGRRMPSAKLNATQFRSSAARRCPCRSIASCFTMPRAASAVRPGLPRDLGLGFRV